MFFTVLDHFDVLMSKKTFKKIKKNIILMCFEMKNTLKSNSNHPLKHALMTNCHIFIMVFLLHLAN
jgi:hypothetical protein